MLRPRGDALEPLTPLPGWLEGLLSGHLGPSTTAEARLSFLGLFLEDAQRHWSIHATEPLSSGPWEERDPEGLPRHLEAMAIQASGRPYVILTSGASPFLRARQAVSFFREAQLEHEELVREMQVRDLLLHCIVHDMGGPLTALSGALKLLREAPDEGDQAVLLDAGERAMTRLQQLVRDTLASFGAGLESLDGQGQGEPADLLRCAEDVREELLPAFAGKGVHLDLETADRGSWDCAGEGSRLRRVVANLLENALRHSPAGSTVWLRLDRPVPGSLRLRVEDQGPGIPAELSARISERGVQGRENAGRAGLGLHYCRATLERWGGRFGHQNNLDRGACFWLQLNEAAGH
ncbi:MAG: HAMP domain-containing sensor histidine kinase [Acidobacteriota bacterium]